jgi:hypothetical protein
MGDPAKHFSLHPKMRKDLIAAVRRREAWQRKYDRAFKASFDTAWETGGTILDNNADNFALRVIEGERRAAEEPLIRILRQLHCKSCVRFGVVYLFVAKDDPAGETVQPSDELVRLDPRDPHDIIDLGNL